MRPGQSRASDTNRVEYYGSSQCMNVSSISCETVVVYRLRLDQVLVNSAQSIDTTSRTPGALNHLCIPPDRFVEYISQNCYTPRGFRSSYIKCLRFWANSFLRSGFACSS